MSTLKFDLLVGLLLESARKGLLAGFLNRGLPTHWELVSKGMVSRNERIGRRGEREKDIDKSQNRAGRGIIGREKECDKKRTRRGGARRESRRAGGQMRLKGGIIREGGGKRGG